LALTALIGLIPLLLGGPLMAQLPPPEGQPAPVTAPLIFDKSLQELEREETITIKESQQLQRGEYNSPQRIVPNISKLCRNGTLSKNECAKANGLFQGH
jgi:hypothetical protein